jgi:hypothetical protein
METEMRKLALMIALTGFASAALADMPAPQGARLSKECRQQLMALCPPGGDRMQMMGCMMTNHDKISPDCQAQLKARMQARRNEMMGGDHPMKMMPPPAPPATH